MAQNPIRKIIQKIGLDLHRHRPQADFFQFVRNAGIKTVLDIGANEGQFAIEVREKMPEVMIYSFEPLKEFFQKLTENFAGDAYFKSFNLALGNASGQVSINRSIYSPSSSLLKMSDSHKKLFPHTKEHTEEIVEVKRLDEIISKIYIKKELLIKVDVQGFEDKVIEGGIETFRKAKIILIETSFTTLYEGQPLFDDIYQKLKSLGFTYNGSLHQKRNKDTGEVIFEDSIFTN